MCWARATASEKSRFLPDRNVTSDKPLAERERRGQGPKPACRCAQRSPWHDGHFLPPRGRAWGEVCRFRTAPRACWCPIGQWCCFAQAPQDNWIVVAIAVAAVIAVLLICLWWWGPKWNARNLAPQQATRRTVRTLRTTSAKPSARRSGAVGADRCRRGISAILAAAAGVPCAITSCPRPPD